MKFARVDRKAKKPTRKHESDAGLDFYALKPVLIRPGEMKIVDTGIAIQLPQGTMGMIKPKSGHNRLIGAGIIDEGYRGEIRVKVYNTGHNNIYINQGDPVAQLIVVPILTPALELVPYQELQETERGTTGGINQ